MGVLDGDFLRLLWAAAGNYVSADESVVVAGEVRPGGGKAPTLRELLFFKLRSRASVSVARATAMRLLGFPGSINYFPKGAPPTDPFLHMHVPMAGVPVGAMGGVS